MNYKVYATVGEDEVDVIVQGAVYEDGEVEFWSVVVEATGLEFQEELTDADEDQIEEALRTAWATDDSAQCVEDRHETR